MGSFSLIKVVIWCMAFCFQALCGTCRLWSCGSSQMVQRGVYTKTGSNTGLGRVHAWLSPVGWWGEVVLLDPMSPYYPNFILA